MAMRRAAARSDEWAQHFSNASCFMIAKGLVYVQKLGFTVRDRGSDSVSRNRFRVS